MAEQQLSGEHRQIVPKDVFDRSNMPSRWERITGVAPKTAPDRQYLSFLAACYRGEERLPHPDTLVAPAEFHRYYRVQLAGRWAYAVAVVAAVAAIVLHQVLPVVLAAVILLAAIVVMVRVSRATAPAINEFKARKSRCQAVYSRLGADPIDSGYRQTLNEMINCDEGTLAYCAAKIAAEIYQDPAWKSDRLQVIAISLLDEVAEIAQSARQLADDRDATQRLELGRLRDDPEVRAMIDADKQLRSEALGLLTARVYAFADYRDRINRLGAATSRENNIVKRAMRLAADEQAIDRLR